MQIDGIETLKLEEPDRRNARIVVAARSNKRVQDVVVMMLDRPRHKEIVAEIRRVGASLRMISDGDIAAAMAPAIPESGIDLYMGIGGSPEAVLAAAGIKCLGGDMQCKMWPRDEKERKQLIADGHEEDLDRVFFGRRPGERQEHYLLRDRHQRQRALARRKKRRAQRDHSFHPDAGEKQDGALHPRLARFAKQNDSAALGQPRTSDLIS